MGERATAHAKNYGVVYLAAFMGAVASIVGTGYTGYQTWDGLATDTEVVQAFADHESEMQVKVAEWTEEQDAKIAGLQDAIDSQSAILGEILQNQSRQRIGKELDALYKYKCRTGSNEFNSTIRRLKDQYRAAVGEPYTQRSCDEYLIR